MYSTKINEQWRAPLTYLTVPGKKFQKETVDTKYL